MADEPWPTGNAATRRHVHITGGSEQWRRTHKEVHADRNSRLRRSLAVRHQDAERQNAGSDDNGEQERYPVEHAGFVGSAASGRPCSAHHVEGEQATKKIVHLMLEESEIRSALAHEQHRYNKHISRPAMPLGTLAEPDRGPAREQADDPGRNVQG